MTLPAQIDSLERAELPARPLHLAIGMFDGVHLGHRSVIDSAVRSARADEALAGVLTFWPHPSALLRPGQATPLIQDAALKSRMLIALGVDVVITQTFTTEVAALAAADFLPWLRRRLPGLVALYVGENFRFGRGRQGDVPALIAAGKELAIRVFSAARVSLDGEPISSTGIRGLLTEGKIAAANARLGYHYSAEGVVAPGKRLGRTLGFPTLNVPWAPDLRPRYGVYAVRAARAGGTEWHPAVANYGLRPTVEAATEPRLEAHLLGPCSFAAGDAVRVEWLSFLRAEMKFASVDELREQIGRDREAAAAFFGR
jgi:riboflavin kinase/FMN adenylyltransferase